MHRPGLHRLAVATVAASVVLPSAFAFAAPAGHEAGHGAFIDHTHVPGGYARSLAIDRSGGEHWIAAGRAYYTLFPGDRKATRDVSQTATGFGSDRPIIRSVVSAVNGKSIDVISANCNSLQVIRVSPRARSLPKLTPKLDVAKSACPSDGNGFSFVAGVTGLAHGRVAVLYTHDPEHPIGTESTVYVGKPGHDFARHVLPGFDSNYISGAAIARDPLNGTLYVAESNSEKAYIWRARTSHDPFHLPKVIAHVGDRELTSLAASHHRVWAAFTVAGRPFTASIAAQNAKGHWTKPRQIGGRRSSGVVQLVAAPSSHQASVWEADSPAVGPNYAPRVTGIQVRHLTGRHIGKPTAYSSTIGDYFESLAVGWNGSVHISHEVV